MNAHPAADIFPLMTGDEFAALKADIEQHGQREPVWILDGAILDGRNRWRACEELGREPVTREYQGNDPVGFVVSLNLHRRHLSESQRAAVASNIATLEQGRPPEKAANLPHYSQAEAAALLNVSERSVRSATKVKNDGAPELVAAVQAGAVSVSAAADVASLTKQEQAEIVARGEREILEAAKRIRANKAESVRASRLERIAEISKGNVDLNVSVRYPVLYADPPWRYEYIETESRAIENQYPTMTHEEICALPVGEIATDDAVLFMWATSPKLAEAIEVLQAWGFCYRTCAVWDKEVIGMGYYFRQQHELLLVATRGSLPPPAPSDRISSVFRIRRLEHSAKPDEVAAAIEAMYPTLPRLELFARRQREGWALWGNQSKVAA